MVHSIAVCSNCGTFSWSEQARSENFKAVRQVMHLPNFHSSLVLLDSASTANIVDRAYVARTCPFFLHSLIKSELAALLPPTLLTCLQPTLARFLERLHISMVAVLWDSYDISMWAFRAVDKRSDRVLVLHLSFLRLPVHLVLSSLAGTHGRNRIARVSIT